MKQIDLLTKKIKMNQFFEPRDFSDSLSETLKFFFSEIKNILLYVLVFIGPLILLNTYLSIHFEQEIKQSLTDVMNKQDIQLFPKEYFYLLAVILIQNFVLVLVISSFVSLKYSNSEKNTELGQLSSLIAKNIIKIILSQILIFLIFSFGIFIIGLFKSTALLFLALIIWGAFVFVSSYLLPFVIVFEGKSLLDSVSRTLFIIKNNRWFTLGTAIFLGILLIIANLIVSWILGRLFSVLPGENLIVISQTIIMFVSVVISSLFSILPAFLYASFIAKKEIAA
jgi:hypothetical protein